MLHLTLQLLVCFTLVLRGLALFGHLRRVWQSDGTPSPEREFQRELRRRGLLVNLPRARHD
jgi:hypothetical protein